MKKRKNQIPDFSAKPKGVPASGNPNPKGQQAPQPKTPVTKPQSTTGKSGHRG